MTDKKKAALQDGLKKSNQHPKYSTVIDVLLARECAL